MSFIDTEDLLNNSMLNLPFAVTIIDRDGTIALMNKAARDAVGIGKEDSIGRDYNEVESFADEIRLGRAIEHLKKVDKSFSRYYHDNATNKIRRMTFARILDNKGQYAGTLLMSMDITSERKKEEELVRTISSLKEQNGKLTSMLDELFFGSLGSLVQLVEAKHKYTVGHSVRVSNTVYMLTEHAMGISSQQADIVIAAKLHDIGKVAIKDDVLNKPAKLTDREYEHIKSHPGVGAKIVANIPRMKDIAKNIRHHHEKFDGTGYPSKLEAGGIPLGSRIIAIADTYDALTSDRPYRKALSTKDAVRIIEDEAGTQLDPYWTKEFVGMVDKGIIL